VRIGRRAILAVLFLAGMLFSAAPRAAAQDSAVLMPEQSAAKAKQLLQQAIKALGGSAYLNVRDATCTGRLGQFDHAGDITGFGKFVDYMQPPYRERQENLPKRNIIEVYNGDKGWVLDRGGVADAPESDLADFQDTVRKDLDNILRHRIHEPGMIFRYGGHDIVDLKEVDWIKLVDVDNRTIRIALASDTHLPIRKVVETRDPRTQMKSEEIEYYSNYHPIDGVETAFQITRLRNGIKIFQVFFRKCEYNTGLSDSLFTKESLEERWAKIGKKESKKRDKKDKKDKDRDGDSNKDKP
jgi:hypothetical protein